MLKAFVVGLVLLVTIQSSALGQLDEQYLIIPGQGIGQIRIGMSLSALTSALGPPTGKVIELGDNLVLADWFTGDYSGFLLALINISSGAGIRVPVGVLAVSITTDAKYATAEGLHIGSTAGEVRAAFGEPSRVLRRSSRDGDYDLMQYWQRGINIAVRHDRVFRILVCPRGLATSPRDGLRWCEVLGY